MRNAKLDKAKRQAAGLMHVVSRFAVGTARDFETSKRIHDHRGVSDPVIGLASAKDRAIPEGLKPCYVGKPQPFDVTGYKVTICKPGTAKGANALNAKRGMATPQNRAHMNTFAFRSKQAPAAIVKSAWRGTVEQVLIPAKR
jgi:hypothetical protein